MAEKWILASPEKTGGKWPGKMAWKMEKMARKRFENGISAHFSHFPGHVSTIFQVRPKSIFRPFSSPFRAGGPKWICTRSTGFQPWVDQSCADCPGFPVPRAGDAPPPELHPGASECAPGLAFVFMALRANSWICCPQLPYHP